jgi:hypothetical protein
MNIVTGEKSTPGKVIYDLRLSLNIIQVIKSSRQKLVVLVARMGS